MSYDELLQAHEFRWFIMVHHFFGLTQFVSRFLKNYSDISYEDFYKKLHKYFSNKPNTVLGKEIQEFKVALKDVFTNDRHWGWYLEDKRTWEFDEGSIVKIWKKIDLFYQEIKDFVLESNYILEENILDAVIYFQKNAIVNSPFTFSLITEIHDGFLS